MRVLITLSHVSNMPRGLTREDVLKWLGDKYRHEASNGADGKRYSGWQLLSRTCDGLSKLLEGGIRREANSRIGALSHHLEGDVDHSGYKER